MNRLMRTAFGMLAAGVLGATASADLIGLRVFRESPGGTGTPPPGTERWIYRVYAEFTHSTDLVHVWGIGAGMGSGSIVNLNSTGQPGSGFTNIPDSETGNLAPNTPGTVRDWDTYMTIGVLYGSEGPGGLNEAFSFLETPMFIAEGATSWSADGAGIGLPPFWTQGRADFRVSGNDTDKHVLLMQLVVNAGEHVSGTIGVMWRAEPSNVVISEGMSFTSLPSPGGALLVAVLMLLHNRRGRYGRQV